MPRLNGTGPTGAGPATGRALGTCQGGGVGLGRRLRASGGNGCGRSVGRGGSPGAGYGRTPFFSSDPAIGQDRAAFANQALLDRRAALQAELARVEAALGAADNANGPDEAGPAAP